MRIHGGFTLVELTVTIAVLAVLLALAVPAWRGLVSDNRMAEAANRIVQTLHHARSEAVRRNRCVQVAAAGSPADWTEGWTVRVLDEACTGVVATLRVEPRFDAGITVSEAAGVTQLVFSTEGALRSPASEVRLDVCDGTRSGEQGRRVRLGVSGRTAVAEIGCS